MHYHVWISATEYVVCDSLAAAQYIVAQQAKPCRVEVWSHALIRIDTYGMAGGPPIPATPSGSFTTEQVEHVK